MQETTIVLGSTNKNKYKEIARLLESAPLKLLSLSDFGPIPEPVEDADTFEENAYIKASNYARMLGLPVLADDSGLVVDALDGAPGVHSARFAHLGATDQENRSLLLSKMEGKEKREAFFVTALVLAVPEGPALTWEGKVDGVLTHEPRGTSGFGYDPVFYYPPFKKTFAELTSDEKNSVSHRGQALNEFKSELTKVVRWLDMVKPLTDSPHDDIVQIKK